MRTLTRRFSVRTLGMLLCAYVWTLVGIGAFRGVSTPHPGVFHLMTPGEIRGAAWIASAVFAVLAAWSRRWSPAALGLLLFMPGVHLVSYVGSWLLYLAPGGSPGFADGWYSGALYLALLGMVLLAALVPSSPPLRPAPVDRVVLP